MALCLRDEIARRRVGPIDIPYRRSARAVVEDWDETSGAILLVLIPGGRAVEPQSIIDNPTPAPGSPCIKERGELNTEAYIWGQQTGSVGVMEQGPQYLEAGMDAE
jgi:hypothetical protein